MPQLSPSVLRTENCARQAQVILLLSRSVLILPARRQNQAIVSTRSDRPRQRLRAVPCLPEPDLPNTKPAEKAQFVLPVQNPAKRNRVYLRRAQSGPGR